MTLHTRVWVESPDRELVQTNEEAPYKKTTRTRKKQYSVILNLLCMLYPFT